MKKINKKLLLVVEPKDATFGSEEQFEQNAILFDEYMLKSFTDDIIPLLNSVTKTEWIKVSDDYLTDNINKKNTFIYMEVWYMDNNKKLYDAFLNYSYSDLLYLLKKAKTKEEQDFYAMRKGKDI